MTTTIAANPDTRVVRIPAGREMLGVWLTVPEGGGGMVLFAEGGDRHSPRNRAIAAELNRAGMATMLVDVLAGPEAQRLDADEPRSDLPAMADRIASVIDWARQEPELAQRPLGLCGAGVGAAVALLAAGQRHQVVRAVVCRAGRLDLAGPALAAVRAPTLLIARSRDAGLIALSRIAMEQLPCETCLQIVLGARHLFAESDMLIDVARLARAWFARHMAQL